MQTKPAPKLLGIIAKLRCECGEVHEFDEIEDGWQYIYPCDCGRRVSIQIGDPIVQYDRSM